MSINRGISNLITTGVMALSLFMASVFVSTVQATNNPGNSNPGNKVTICHATGSQSNPYVRITVNANGAVHGHDKHGRDIIPPFKYNQGGQQKNYPGKNWNAQGQAIYNNGCKPSGQTTSPQQNPPVTGNNNTQPTGGSGGGQVAGAATQQTGGRGGGSAQVAAPVGAVNAGTGGAVILSPVALASLVGSLGIAAYGFRRLG